MNEPSKPEVTRAGALDMQVCVPKTFTDEQIIKFAEGENPCGTSNGWFVRGKGEPAERVQCSQRDDCVHVVLEA